jgi:hypothetical protein
MRRFAPCGHPAYNHLALFIFLLPLPWTLEIEDQRYKYAKRNTEQNKGNKFLKLPFIFHIFTQNRGCM